MIILDNYHNPYPITNKKYNNNFTHTIRSRFDFGYFERILNESYEFSHRI